MGRATYDQKIERVDISHIYIDELEFSKNWAIIINVDCVILVKGESIFG